MKRKSIDTITEKAKFLYDIWDCPIENCERKHCRRDRCVPIIAKELAKEKKR